MKRKSSSYRRTALPALFLRPSTDHQPDLARLASVNEQRGLRARKIFVIERTRCVPSTIAAPKKIRRVLIFDNHPDSLRLVFGKRANPYVDLSGPQRVRSWELVLISVLVLGLFIAMFWPLF
jgi:hypothetical protein